MPGKSIWWTQSPTRFFAAFAFTVLVPLASASVLSNASVLSKGNGVPPSPMFPAGTGAVIGLNVTPGAEITQAQTTPRLVIETNAPHFTAGSMSAHDGTAGSEFARVPASAVSEPASLALVGAGILVVGGFVRKLSSERSRRS